MDNSMQRSFSISSYDLDPRGQARLTSMANYFQEMAYQHAGQLGFGYNDLKENQTFWVLARMKIRILRYPVWDEQIMVETWHNGMDRLFGMRDFKVMDYAGNPTGMATTAWIVLDARTRKPIRPDGELLRNRTGDGPVFAEKMEKIILPEKMDHLSTHTVVFSDLDIVGHVNNVKYMEWCIDSATFENRNDWEIREIEINFMHESLLGDDIEISGGLNPGADSFFLARRKEDDREIFRARIEWAQVASGNPT